MHLIPCGECGEIWGDSIFLKGNWIYHTVGQNFWSNPNVWDSDKVRKLESSFSHITCIIWWRAWIIRFLEFLALVYDHDSPVSFTLASTGAILKLTGIVSSLKTPTPIPLLLQYCMVRLKFLLLLQPCKVRLKLLLLANLSFRLKLLLLLLLLVFALFPKSIVGGI